jgi:hypothetical protein
MRHHTLAPIRPIAAIASVAPIEPHKRSVGAQIAFATVRQFYQRQLREKFARLVNKGNRE